MINTKSFFKTFLALVLLFVSSVAMADRLPVDASQTKITGDQLFVYFTGDGGFSYAGSQMSQYTCTNVNRIADKAGAYLYIILNGADASQERSYELTWTDGANSKCAIITFAASATTDPTITDCAGGEQGGGEQGGEPSQEPETPSVIDWSSIAWVANSSDKFKIGAADDENLPNVVEVQQPGWAAKRGIYLTFPAADITCSHNHAVQGAGMILYTDQFIAKETLVTVNYAGGSKTFVVFYKDGIDFSTPAPAYSEYCNYSGPQTTQDGKACSITWVTNNNGDVVITLSDGPAGGYTGVSFRGDCFEGDFDKFKVISEANGIENASVYFTRERSAAENYYILRKNATALPAGKIVIWTNATLAWKSNENASRWQNGNLEFSYTYGTTCPTLDAPTNVAVADNGTITFDAVVGAEKYVAHVFNGVKEVYNSEVTNGGVIDYHVYEATTLTVKLEAVTGGMSSDLSDAATWNIAVSPLPASVWCETAGVITTEHETCHPAFTINTLANGNVTIEIRPTEGTEDGAKFRGANGMNGTFKLNGSSADFTACFDKALSPDKKVVTLSLKGDAPAVGSIIDYTGQIEAASSLHGNDWSDYKLLGYVYGSKCPTDVPVTGVTLNLGDASVPVNKTLTLVATVAPANAGNKNIIWTSSNDEIATVANGVVTPQAVGGPVAITARTEDGDFEAICAVTVTAAKATEPEAAPTAPTYAADKVRAVYSATYETTCNHGAWGGSQSFTKEEYGIKVVLNPGNGYVGFVDFPARNCAAMEYFHADVWVADDASMRFVPITGQTERGVTKNLTGAQWNSIDIALNEGDWARTTDWTNVFQIKIDQAAGLTFWINNIYFYTTSEDDVTKPVMTSATLESASYMSAIINVAATDDRGVTKYVVKNGDAEVGKFTSADGKINVSGLTDATAYTLSIYAEDAAENVSDNKVDVELTTLTMPVAPTAPNVAGKEYRTVYAPSLTNMLKHDFILANWGSAAGNKVDANGYIFYHTTNNASVVWGENNAGGNAIVAADAYKGNKGGLDASEMEYMHFDIWADKAGCNSLVVVIDDRAYNAAQTLAAGWNSFDLALSNFAWTANPADYNQDNVAWIKFTGLNNTNDVAVTNVYFWKEIPAANYSLTTEDTDFYTFFADEEVSIPAGMQAFTGVLNNGALELTELTDVIPAQTGVLVKTEAAGEYNFVESYTNAAAVAENSLRGVAVATPLATVVAAESERLGAAADIYVVGKKNDVVGFYKSTKTNVSAHRAYVPVTEAMKPAAGAPIRIVMQADTATGMENVATSENVVKFIENGKLYIRIADRVYDATGRLVK